MAEITRKISTRMAIEGEAEYKQKITDINRSMRTLQSEIALTDSKFKGNANTIEALTAKNDVLGRAFAEQTKKVQFLKDALANAEKAAGNYAKANVDIKSKIEATEKELADLKNTSGDTTKEQERLSKQLQLLNKDLQDNESRTAATERGILDWQKQLNNAEIELNDINGELKNNSKYMDEAKNSVDGAATSIDKYGKEVKTASDKNTKAVSDMAQALAAAGVVASIKAITEALMESIKASMEWESAFAGVIKTVDGTDAQLANIADGIKEMSLNIPASTTEIAKIAETAGQLGIKTEDVLKFSETMMALGVSTNLTAEDAATMIAQFANITKLDSSKYGNLGSAIVSLGNNYATTEQKIMDMSQKIASAATIAGFSETDILGLSTAVSSLGIESDAGGSAMSKLIAKMQSAVETGEGLNDFAYVANMSAEDFTKLWGEDAAGALSAFVGGLSDTERTGSTALVMLDEMGLSEVRLRNAVLSLSNAGGLLNNTLKTSKSAFEDNNALQEEAAKRYATSESKAKLLKNSFNNLKIAVGDQLKPVIDRATDAGRKALDVLTAWVQENPQAVKAITIIVTALGLFAGALAAYTVAVKVAKAAHEAFTSTLGKGTVWGIVLTAIGALVSALALFGGETKNAEYALENLADTALETKDALSGINDSFKDAESSTLATVQLAEKYVDKLEALEKQGVKTKDQQEEYAMIVEWLNDLMPDLNLQIDEETGYLKDSTKAIRDNILAWKEKALQEAYQDSYVESLKQQIKVEKELEENKDTLASKEERLIEVKKLAAIYEKQKHELQQRYSEEELIAGGKMYDVQQGYLEQLDAIYEEQKELQGQIPGLRDAVKEGEGAFKDAANATEYWGKKMEETAGAGEIVIDTLISSIRERRGEYAAAMKSLAEAGNKSFKATWQIRSPSRVAREDVKNIIEGYVKETKEREKEYAAAMEGLAEKGAYAYTDRSEELQKMIARSVPTDISVYATAAQQTELANAINRMTANNQNSKVDSLMSLLREYLPRLSNMQVVTDTGALVGAIVPQMDMALANLQTKKERGK